MECKEKSQKWKYQVPVLNNSQVLVSVSKKKKKKIKAHSDDKVLSLHNSLHKQDAFVPESKDGSHLEWSKIASGLYRLNTGDEDRKSKKRKRECGSFDVDKVYIFEEKEIRVDCDVAGGKMSGGKNVLRSCFNVDDNKILKRMKHKESVVEVGKIKTVSKEKRKHEETELGHEKPSKKKEKYEESGIKDKKMSKKRKCVTSELGDEKISEEKREREENAVGDKKTSEKKKHEDSDGGDEKISEKIKHEEIGMTDGKISDIKKGQKSITSSRKKRKVYESTSDGRVVPFTESEELYTQNNRECLEVLEPHENKKGHLYIHKDSEFDSTSDMYNRKTIKNRTKNIKTPQFLNSDSGLDVKLSNVNTEVQSSDDGLVVQQSEMGEFREIIDKCERDYLQERLLDYSTGRDSRPGVFSDDCESETVGKFNSGQESSSHEVRSREEGRDETSSCRNVDLDQLFNLRQENHSEEEISMDKILQVLDLKGINNFKRGTRKHVLKNLKSFKEATEEEISKLRNMEKWRCSVVKSRPVNSSLYEEAPFVGDRSILKTPKAHQDYWKLLYSKIEENDLTEEEINEEIEERMMNLVKKWDRVGKGILEEDDGSPVDFFGPYIPKEGHMQLLKSLDIKVKRKINYLHERSWHSSLVQGATARSHKILLEEGLTCKAKQFSRRENEILVKNWERFKKEFKFCDIRPLINVRTMVLRKEGDEYVWYRLNYLSIKQKLDFLMYMLEDLPNRILPQVYDRLHSMAHYIQNGYEHVVDKVSGRDVARIENLLKRFGMDYMAMELLLGKKHNGYYNNQCHIYLTHRKTKFFTGPWDKDEELRFLQGIYQVMRPKNVSDLIKDQLPWKKIAAHVGTRTAVYCCNMWRRRLGQLLTTKEKVVYEKEKPEWPQLTDEEKLKLIELVYESEADVLARVDWKGLCRDHFPKYFHTHLAGCFYNLYTNRVPNENRRHFDDGVEYLYKFVRPLLQKKVGRNKRRLKDVSKLIENLPLAKEVLEDRYGDSHDVDEDEDVISDPLDTI